MHQSTHYLDIMFFDMVMISGKDREHTTDYKFVVTLTKNTYIIIS